MYIYIDLLRLLCAASGYFCFITYDIVDRTIYAHALKELPGKKSLWIKAAELEKVHGTPEALEEILDRAVRYCPKVSPLSINYNELRVFGLIL